MSNHSIEGDHKKSNTDETIMEETFDEPRNLVPQILEHLNPIDDVETQREIENNLKKAETMRTQLKEQAYKSLSELERKVELLKDIYSNKLIERECSSSVHSSKMIELTKTKFCLNSEVDDYKRTKENLKKELEALTLELQKVEQEELAESEIPPDEISLKLQISHALGIDLLQNHQGEFDKARVS